MSATIPTAIRLVQATQADTVVMVPARDALDWLQAGGVFLVIVLLFALLGVLVRVLRTVDSMQRSVKPVLDRADKGLEPVLERARSVSENVDYVSHVIRQDVEGLTKAIERIRGRLDQASDRMEERIEEFNALMELVQSEAEEIFLDTASTVRGVRAGSRSLAGAETEGRDEPAGERRSEDGEPRPGPAPPPGPPARSANPDAESANAAE